LKRALEELEKLRNLVPCEPKMYFLIGKIHKAMGNKSQAMENFTLALNINPKIMPEVETAINRMDDVSIESLTGQQNKKRVVIYRDQDEEEEEDHVQESTMISS